MSRGDFYRVARPSSRDRGRPWFVSSLEKLGAGPATVLLKGVKLPPNSVGRAYDVSPDGSRFLFIKDAPEQQKATDPPTLHVVLN